MYPLGTCLSWEYVYGYLTQRRQQWGIQEFCSGGFQQIQLRTEDRGQRERGSGGGSPLVRGSGGSCNLLQEAAAHMVKFS